MRKPRLNLPLAAAVVGLALALAAPAGRPRAAETLPEDLGTVRNDTLHVTLDKVRAAALAHNEMLAAGEAMVDAARGDALGAWRGFLPRVQAAEFFLRSDDALSSFGYKLQQRSVTQADFYPPTLNDPGVAENNLTRLQLLQPIFNGGMALYGKRAADAMARAADHDYRRAAQTVEFQAIQACEGLVLAKAYERVMLDAVAAAEAHARQAQSMVEAEMATEADLLQARVYLGGVKQKLIEVRNLIAIAGENIKLLTALRTDLPLAPADDFVDPARTPAAGAAGPDLVGAAARCARAPPAGRGRRAHGRRGARSPAAARQPEPAARLVRTDPLRERRHQLVARRVRHLGHLLRSRGLGPRENVPRAASAPPSTCTTSTCAGRGSRRPRPASRPGPPPKRCRSRARRSRPRARACASSPASTARDSPR